MTHYVARVNHQTEAFELWVQNGLIVQLKLGDKFVHLQTKDKQQFNSANFLWVKRID